MHYDVRVAVVPRCPGSRIVTVTDSSGKVVLEFSCREKNLPSIDELLDVLGPGEKGTICMMIERPHYHPHHPPKRRKGRRPPVPCAASTPAGYRRKR